jgi:integrase
LIREKWPKKYVPPTKSGRREVRIVPELVAELKAYREAGSGEGLLLRTGKGNAMNPSNVHRDIWRPLLKRAGVPARDIYSARHTYASLARTAGESALNVGQSMGHARSKLVDDVYAHVRAEGLASVAHAVGRVCSAGLSYVQLTGAGGRCHAVRQRLDDGRREDRNWLI